jgi:hypothetical protein
MSSSDGAADAGKSDAAQPTITMHSRFVTVADNAQLKLKEEAETKKSTQCERTLGDKKYQLFRRDIIGGPTWFRVDDHSTEIGKICFATDVSPETRDCSLQNLLLKMDNAILSDFEERDNMTSEENADQNIADVDAVQKRVQAFTRKQVMNRTIFSYDETRPRNRKGKHRASDDEIYASDRRKGRTVFYVTVGQMKHTRIKIKSALEALPSKGAQDTYDNFNVNGKTSYVPHTVVERLKDKAQETLEKHFADKPRAQKFLKENIDNYDAAEDKDFEFYEEDDPAIIAQVMDCLVVLANNAKENNAAIIVPDYMTSSGNSKLIENALDFVEFDGPVISISVQEQVAWNETTAGETYPIGDRTFPKGIPHSRVTHSIHIPHSSYSKVAARIAKVISDPDLDVYPEEEQEQLKKKSHSDGSNRNQRILVLAGGGIALLYHMGEAVKEGLPVVVLQGSRRLCDYLPQLWVRRFSAKFDIYEETLKLADAIGFPNARGTALALLVRQIVEQGHVSIHQLSTGVHSLRRILQSLQVKDERIIYIILHTELRYHNSCNGGRSRTTRCCRP